MTAARSRTTGSSTVVRYAAQAVVVVAVAIGIVLLGRVSGRYLTLATARIHTLGAWAPAVFVATYAAACVALVPASLLTLAGGVLFGLVEGTILVFVGATIGAAVAFLLARYVARGAVARRLAAHPRFDAIDRAIGVDGFKIVALLRLSPLFPFSFMNYALGLTRVGFVPYLLASVGMIPGVILYVYSGMVAGDVVTAATGGHVHRGAIYYAVLAAGFVATVLVTVLVTRIARTALESATGPGSVTQEMQIAPMPTSTDERVGG